jgi:hypothetical protein
VGVTVLVGVTVGVIVLVGVIDGVIVGVTVLVGVFVGVIVLVGVTEGVAPGVDVFVGVVVGVKLGVFPGVDVFVGVAVGVAVGVGLGPGTHSSLFVHTPPNNVIVNPGVLGTCDEHTYTVANASTDKGLEFPLPIHGLYDRFFVVPSFVTS